jgi:hypothetical protein
MARNYAPLPHEYLQEMAALSDEEFGRLIRALLQYSMTGQMPELTGIERILLPRVKMQEDRFRANYAELSAARSEAGKKGAKAKLNKDRQREEKAGKEKQTPAKRSNTETKTNTNTDLSPSNGKEDHGARQPKVQWAENVTMTNDEYEKLLAAHGPADTARLIAILDNYKGASGKRYASDYRAILSWVVDRLREEKQKGHLSKPDIRNNGKPGDYEDQALAKLLAMEKECQTP